MNTFFISPLIPLGFYIIIQKEKNNPVFNWNKDEIDILNNINILFDYSNHISDDDKNIVYNIVDKIINTLSKYNSLLNKYYMFTNQNTYKEITNYNYIYYNLLKERNYEQIINPYLVNSINMCVGLTDTGPFKDLNISKFKTLNTDIEKFEYIDYLIKLKEQNVKEITFDIMSKSHISSKINIITKILSNKSILYDLLNQETFIPKSDSFEITSDDLALNDIIENFINNIKSDYFVIKPSEGTLSDGVGIFNKNELNLNFVKNWINNPENNKYSFDGKYSSWILSEFIQSFLWKLNGQNITSKVFKQLSQKETKLKFNYDDKIGRINKFRFWALYTIIDGEFTSYLYKNGYCEIALEELTNYSKTQLDPANIETFYENLLDVEENTKRLEEIVKEGAKTLEDEKIEAAFVGTYLDYARVVNEFNYPLGQDAWNNDLMPQMYYLVNILASKMKRFMNCLNKYTLKGSKGCYSFFALDIIIDSNSKPWLLETNSRPFIGFDNFFNKYDPNNEHVLNVNSVLNTVLGLTTDIVNPSGNKSVEYSDFLVTHIDKIQNCNSNNIYIPFSLAIKKTPTSKIYNKIYNVLDDNNYQSFPYPHVMGNKLNKSIAFRGTSTISKFLISKIKELGNDKFISLMQELYPYDAKVQIFNKISTLGFYLGDKKELTDILKLKLKNWDSIIPYSITIDISKKSNNEIIDIIKNSPLNNTKIIAKPSSGQQGIGIIIDDNPNSLINTIKNNNNNNNNNNNENVYVFSKYLDNPFLIKLNKTGVSGVIYNDLYGRKTHLRAYVLVYKTNNQLKVYLYKESLIFCAVKEYNSCNSDNVNSNYCNLTNLYFASKYYKDVLNKNPDDAYKDLSGIAKDLIPNKYYSELMNKIKYIIKQTIFAVKNNLLCINNNNKCYQYIAFDFHLENQNEIPHPWLLEVNSTPGLKAPDFHWVETGGVKNFLESILNITIGTKISNTGKQMFEYLPYNKKVSSNRVDEIFLNKINNYSCMSNYYVNLKKVLKLLNYPGRSYLTTKKQMCNAIKNI